MDSRLDQKYDVAILGGGLAGLSLALQCRQQAPRARIVVLEKNRHPAPEAAFKVGESTVEVGTHYFLNVLGLKRHMDEEQLPKLGLRFFFRGGDNRAIERRLELGGTDFPPAPSYQLDRGRLENYLAKQGQDQGIDFLEGATVKDVELARGRKDHHVRFVRDEAESRIASRWIADCSGRAAILKRKLGLEKEATHHANAAWFRIKTEIKVDDWSDDSTWSEKYDMDVNPRWLSTNHLMGEGYWVWLIPLASGCTSIGIVADENLHPLSEFNTLDKALRWLDRHEPQCAEHVRANQDQVQDFLAIKDYARECKQVFSSHRWGITGEAGFFLDPFYSPGSDFIGIGNTFLCELIRRDLAGKSNLVHATAFDYLYKRFHYGTAPVYKDQYPLFGNHQVMPVKILWDYLVYWMLTAHIFCHGKTVDLRVYARNLSRIKRLDVMNTYMQKFFRIWHKHSPSVEATGRINTRDISLILETNRALLGDLNNREFAERFEANVAQVETLFWEIIDHSGVDCQPPFKRRSFPKSVKGSFDLLFKATQRRANAQPSSAPREAHPAETA